MANAVYPEYKEFLLAGAANVSLDQNDATNGPFCSLVDLGTYTYSALHDFFDDLSGIVGTDQRITTPTIANGVFDGDNLTYTAVTGASIEALIIYRHNAGANTTWKLVLFLDTSVTGLPVTPNGGNITVTWGANIFTISDRRMKENIEEVGLVNGKLPLYRYNYVFDEKPRVGLMAQDVEKVCPDAVMDFGKYKAVNYPMALAA